MNSHHQLTEGTSTDAACAAIGDTLAALTNLSIELERLIASTDDEDIRAVDFLRLAEVTSELRDLQSSFIGKQEHAQRRRALLGAPGIQDE